MAKVYIGFDDYAIDGVDDELIHSVFNIVINIVRLSDKTEVGLVLTTDDKIRQLNKQYRDNDSITNVLSFGYHETSQDDFLSMDDKNYLGDIYICRTEVERQAKELGVTQQQEFMRLFVHGLLHLAGIHHNTKTTTAEMEKLEDEIIAQIVQK